MKTPLIARPESGEDEGKSRIPDWREILTILSERAWIGLAVMTVVFLGIYIHVKRSTPYYRSTAVLMVEAQAPRVMNYQDVVALNVRNIEYFNTVITLLHSRQIIDAALRQSGLADRADFLPGVVDKAAAARGLFKISPVAESRLIHVTVEHQDPVIASDLANALARAYIQQDLDTRMGASMQAVEWLKERSVEYRNKLETGLLALQQYREDAQSVSLEEDENIVIVKLKALNAVLTAAQTERIEAESQWQTAKKQRDGGMPVPQLAVQLDDPLVAAALAKLREHQQVLVQLQQRYKENYPDLQEALVLERDLLRSLDAACNMAVYVLKMRYEALQAKEENLQKALREQEKEAFALGRALVNYNDLKRNVEADENIYQSVLTRMREAGVSETLPTEIIRIAEEARPARIPFRPQPRRHLMRGALLSVVVGLGVVFLLYYSDHRFRRNEEVERALGLPVLASLPLIPGKSIHERGLVSHLNQAGEMAEAFRTLRAAMQINPWIKDARVLLITSTQPGDGKSLVSTNLATTFAQDHSRTLLIGADFRRPALSQIFELAGNTTGLAAVLKGEISWRDALQTDCIPNLDVLPSGPTPEHPSELLGNKRLAALIEEVRGLYEHVIIDAPPVLGVSDTLVLLRHTDGVLFVVRYGVTHSMGAGHAVRRINESGAPCLGVLMNGVSMRTLANYHHYQRYGYGYKAEGEAAAVPPAAS